MRPSCICVYLHLCVSMYARMRGQGIQLLVTKRLFKLLETVGPWPEPYTVACTFRRTPQLRASVRRRANKCFAGCL